MLGKTRMERTQSVAFIAAMLFLVMASSNSAYFPLVFLCLALSAASTPLMRKLVIAMGVVGLLLVGGYEVGKQLALRDAASCAADACEAGAR